MENKIKSKKRFSIASMITSEIIIIYLVLRVGDIIMLSYENIGSVVARYIPVGIATIICTYFLIKFGAKRSFKSEKDLFVKQIMIVPVIVAIVIFLYGMYSIKTNASKIEKTYEAYTSGYSSILKDYSKIYEDTLKEAKKNARISWAIRCVTYFICSGAVTFMLKNKIDDYLQYDDELYDIEQSDNSKVVSKFIDNDNEENINETSEMNENIDNNENKENENEAINNIKWDL